ncbi:MAG: RNA polymerase sigma factor [Planctomycetota bacterium]|jgi:RNA polymerase sigma-70 factor (ECF subfamily)
MQDKLLVWKFRNGSAQALQRIYQKYKNDLLALAIALSNDKAAAEDIVHDVFVSFAQSAGKLQLRTNLKGYLSTSVANRVRNLARRNTQQTLQPDAIEIADADSNRPDRVAIAKEQIQRIGSALTELPYEQREVIILRLQSGLRFKEIAESQQVSLNTIQSRYRYALNKLQSIVNGEVRK